jgi:hypothetical protein
MQEKGIKAKIPFPLSVHIPSVFSGIVNSPQPAVSG